MTSQYIAILGRQPELGLIELESVLGTTAVQQFGAVAILEAKPVYSSLGGTVKLARLIEKIPYKSLTNLDIDTEIFPQGDDKLIFGVSFYGSKLDPHILKKFSLGLKRKLQESGRSVRYLAPKFGTVELTAAQLKFNGIPETGAELIIVRHHNEMLIGITEEIQDIDGYSERDHGRPARSAKVGMLPPKLAQLLINTTKGSLVFDPFCGTGVVLQESYLMGRTAAGSDLSQEMVTASRTNMQWLQSKYGVDSAECALELVDATSVRLPKGDISIVSEGYLGPNLMSPPQKGQLGGLIRPLRQLYTETLRNISTQVAPGTDISICAPAWSVDGEWVPLPLVDVLPDLGYTVKVFNASKDSCPVYGRPGQAVGRALYLLTKV
jgi:tRNA G10  N-methylase Trm11